jgi:hypothetical protein
MNVFTQASIVTLAAVIACLGEALAQPANFGCTASPSPALTQTLTCNGGITIVVESGAQFTLLDRDRNGRVDAVDLQSKAVLVNVPKQKGGRRFEVLTPQAIAAVRGTEWAVDAESNKTSVFVQAGSVGVRRPVQPGSVTLSPGDGVDVDTTATPLVVRRWPDARVAALMARLGH